MDRRNFLKSSAASNGSALASLGGGCASTSTQRPGPLARPRRRFEHLNV